MTTSDDYSAARQGGSVDCIECGEPDMLFYPGEDGEPDIYECPECGATEEVDGPVGGTARLHTGKKG